jgi:hypothetical protein
MSGFIRRLESLQGLFLRTMTPWPLETGEGSKIPPVYIPHWEVVQFCPSVVLAGNEAVAAVVP